MEEARFEPRSPHVADYFLTWKGRDGKSYLSEGRGFDLSPNGVGIECPCEIKCGTMVRVKSRDGSINADCEVVHCSVLGSKYRLGFEIRDTEHRTSYAPPPTAESPDRAQDYYEILQISPKAEMQTIHRVFRIMAARFHPDNPQTGDLDQFLRMKRAYSVLSDPERRAEYDSQLDQRQEEGPIPIFAMKEFVTGLEAESNRRLGVLSLLYNQRRTTPDHPGVSLLDLEKQMGFPREYLSFTMWYLRSKEFITVADNSDYALTAAGADYVEEKAARNDIVGKLLRPGSEQRGDRPARQPVSTMNREPQTDRHFLLGPAGNTKAGSESRPKFPQ